MVVFLWGFGGSVAVEVVSIFQFFHDTPIKFPERYSRFWYYVIRLFLAFIGGGLAVAYGIEDKPLLAVNIGASAPLIIHALRQAVPKASSNGG